MLATTGLCRCICGTGRKDHFDPNRQGGTDFDGAEETEDAPPCQQPPEDNGLLSYCVMVDQPLRGVPIREGELWYLSAEESIDRVTLSLYVNGFSFLQGQNEVSISLSPFALVRNCKFQSTYTNSLNLADFKIFKVSLFTQGICYYFGVRTEDERQAEEERSRWVLDFSRVMRLVTQSLFPPFSISCDPIEAVVTTQRRLMAGYLIHHEDSTLISVLYCELHPHCEDQAKLTLYENELCHTPVMDIYITDRSICCEKVGINCSCFCVEDHQFGTRTLSERKLWLRAISNVKVKLQNRAPNPTWEEIKHYRLAIKEHIDTIRATLVSKAPTDALLRRSAQQDAQVTDVQAGAPELTGGIKPQSNLQPPAANNAPEDVATIALEGPQQPALRAGSWQAAVGGERQAADLKTADMGSAEALPRPASWPAQVSVMS